MEHAFQISGETYEVWLSHSRRGHDLHQGTRRIPITLIEQGENHLDFIVKDKLTRVYFAIRGDEVYVHHDGESFMLSYLHSLDRFASQKDLHSEAVARAPMPGAVISIAVQTGQEVHRGDQMVVIESMKMETAICAAIDGVVQEVHVQLGQTFERDAVLVTLNSSKVTA
jgi:acetyl/propionyl-CoA carboxylase alpha subunit